MKKDLLTMISNSLIGKRLTIAEIGETIATDIHGLGEATCGDADIERRDGKEYIASTFGIDWNGGERTKVKVCAENGGRTVTDVCFYAI